MSHIIQKVYSERVREAEDGCESWNILDKYEYI